MTAQVILSLDQGTTSSRAILFGQNGRRVATAQKEYPQILPSPGEVEHNPEDIWSTQRDVAIEVLEKASLTAKDVAAIGITNQRETTILWDKKTGQPIDNAIVWQSRVTTPICDQLKKEGHEETFRNKTGLLVDAYFSGTKIKHLLDKHDPDRARSANGDILFGTVDCFLIWKLTGGKVHATDYSNASRTLVFNIHTLKWDDELLEILNIPKAILPEVHPSSYRFGETSKEILGEAIPITGVAGDQQAALFGQTCFTDGDVKNTYGTGCFMVLNTGEKPVQSDNKLLTTIAWGLDGKVTYALEGSVFIAGAVVQWLRDGLGIIKKSSEVETLSETVEDNGGIYVVPAFVGLGAPHWDPYARGAIFGITRGTTAGHIARAAVESMAFQSRDLLEAMRSDSGLPIDDLKVDGGASVNERLMQFQSDILNVSVQRPVVPETTALGAAYLAGLEVGYWNDLEHISENWVLDSSYEPKMEVATRNKLCRKWDRAVERSLNWEDE